MDPTKNFLTELMKPKEPNVTELDIVAVHGLNPFKNKSNAISTWTADNGKMWLRDEGFLPTHIPNARILLFGYNSNVAFTSSNAGLDQQASALLLHLERLRDECPNRPIIFLCHSLGGILVKRALVQAHLDDSHAQIYMATFGVAFFGTPHGGGNNANVGALAAGIAKSLTLRRDNSFMEALKKGSYYSDQNRADFLHRAKDFSFLTFYEANPTRRFKLITTQVVDRKSAILGLDDEKEPKFPMDADHSNVCKFGDPKGEDYLTVSRSIFRMSKQAVEKFKGAKAGKGATAGCGILIADSNTAEKENGHYILPSIDLSCYVERPTLTKKLQEYSVQTDRTTSPVTVLLGMGGQGKSQLAIQFCRVGRAAGEFEAIFWIDATSDKSLSRSFDEIIQRISKSVSSLESIDSKATFVKNAIEGWSFPWLLIYDNYDQLYETFTISTSFPQSKFGYIIVTSRHASAGRLGKTVDVSGMLVGESLELLFSRSGLECTDENVSQAKNIVARLGYLPLAIDQASAYINVQCLSLQQFTIQYEQRQEQILRYIPLLSEYREKLNDSDAETALNVFTTLELSLKGLSRSPETKEALENFLSLAAFFSNTSIGEDLIITAAMNNTSSWTNLFTSGDIWDHYKYQDSMAHLNHLSLFQSLSSSEDVIYFSLHPLVADWLKLRRGRPVCQANTLQSCSVIAEMIDSNDIGAMQLASRQYFLAQVDSCVQNQRLYVDVLDWENEAVLQQLSSFATFLRNNARYKEAEDMYQRALQGYEKMRGVDHRSTLLTANNLGILHREQGKLKEAEEMLQRALLGKEKTLGTEHGSTLETVHNLGILYNNQGRLQEAEEMYQRALQGSEKALGMDHTLTLSAVENLGILYHNRGNLHEAEEMYHRALQGFEKALGTDHTLTLNAVENLGILYHNRGNLHEAEEMYHRALQGFERALGLDHKTTLDTVHKLGSLYLDEGKVQKAERMFLRALQGFEKVLSVDHETTLSTVEKLSVLYHNQSRLKKAEEMYRRALQGKEKALGTDHTSTLDTINKLGNLYLDEGRLQEAEEMYRRALQGFEKALGIDHISTLDTVNNLGNLYLNQGRLEGVEEMYQRALQGKKKALGTDHTSTLNTVSNLGKFYLDQGRSEEAEVMYRRALLGFERTLGAEHPSTKDVARNLDGLTQSPPRRRKRDILRRLIM